MCPRLRQLNFDSNLFNIVEFLLFEDKLISKEFEFILQKKVNIFVTSLSLGSSALCTFIRYTSG